MGFSVKVATILFHEDWEYDIQIADFDQEKFCIDRPKHMILEGRGLFPFKVNSPGRIRTAVNGSKGRYA